MCRIRFCSERFFRFYYNLFTSRHSWADLVVEQIYQQYGIDYGLPQ